jgi:hypothetical protein
MEARKKELLGRISRCVRVWVALAKSAAPAEQGDKQGDKQGDRKGEKREERWEGGRNYMSFPTKPASFASSAELRLVLHVLSCFESITLPFLKTVAYLLHYLLSPVHSSGSLSPHPQSHATLVRRTMTTISKDAQQSSYPYVMDNRFTTPWTDDKRHFTVR